VGEVSQDDIDVLLWSKRPSNRGSTCLDYESQEPLRVSILVDSLERQAIWRSGGIGRRCESMC